MGTGPVVTLLTDFGTADSYVAEMKGVMLGIVPTVRFVDITHAVEPGNLVAAQFLLGRSWHRFPESTVHLAVVDPGVGTDRRALAARYAGHGFVAPDNGLLTPILDHAEVVALPVPANASATFHGRDVFAPAAARLAAGAALEELGLPIDRPVRNPLPTPGHEADATVGTVLYVDRFGTLVSNIPGEGLPAGSVVRVGEIDVGPLRRTFGDVGLGSLVSFIGSGGTVEIAVRDGSAARVLGARTGASVTVTVRPAAPA